MGFFSKIPMLALKTSTLTLTWHCVGADQRASTLSAVALGWYALLPVLRTAAASSCEVVTRLSELRDTAPLWVCLRISIALFSFIAAILLAILLVHVIGLVCPSHDLSIFHGCTPPSNVDYCILP